MIEKLLNKMTKIDNDKLLHFLYGAIIFSISFILIQWLAILVVTVLAVGKEIYDSRTPNHTASLGDIFATLAGAIIVALPLIF